MTKKVIVEGEPVKKPGDPVDATREAMLASRTSDALRAQAGVQDVELEREFVDKHAEAVRKNAEEAAAAIETPSQAEYRKLFAEYEKRNPVKAKMKRESGEFDRKLAALKK